MTKVSGINVALTGTGKLMAVPSLAQMAECMCVNSVDHLTTAVSRRSASSLHLMSNELILPMVRISQVSDDLFKIFSEFFCICARTFAVIHRSAFVEHTGLLAFLHYNL